MNSVLYTSPLYSSQAQSAHGDNDESTEDSMMIGTLNTD